MHAATGGTGTTDLEGPGAAKGVRRLLRLRRLDALCWSAMDASQGLCTGAGMQAWQGHRCGAEKHAAMASREPHGHPRAE